MKEYSYVSFGDRDVRWFNERDLDWTFFRNCMSSFSEREGPEASEMLAKELRTDGRVARPWIEEDVGHLVGPKSDWAWVFTIDSGVGSALVGFIISK